MSMRSFRIAPVLVFALTAFPVFSGDLNPPSAPSPSLIEGLRLATPITAVPVTIEQSGVYYLTRSFSVSSTIASGIAVRADDVVIDLAGYALIGPSTGTGRGVSAEAPVERTTVRNGTIRDFGGVGVVLNVQGTVEDLRIDGCPVGLGVSTGSSVRRVQVADCEVGGMQVTGSGVIDCSVTNCGVGIAGIFPTQITRCSVLVAQDGGIVTLGPVRITECNVFATPLQAFRGSTGTVYEDCTAATCATGFEVVDGGTIVGCVARSVSVEGIAVTGTSGRALITDCHISEAPIGIRVERPATILRNYVNDTSTNGIQISAATTDVTVLDNVVMNATTAINHLGLGNNCFYARNTYTGGVNLGANATWGPFVFGSGNLNGAADGDNPWANIQH